MRERTHDSGPPSPSTEARGLELAFVPDDADDPTEVTVYPDVDVDVTTAWITMDVDHVVDLTEHA